MLQEIEVVPLADIWSVALISGVVSASFVFLLIYLWERALDFYSEWKNRNPGSIEDASNLEEDNWTPTAPVAVQIANRIRDEYEAEQSIHSDEREEDGHRES